MEFRGCQAERACWKSKMTSLPSNKSIDTDALAADFARLLFAGHFRP